MTTPEGKIEKYLKKEVEKLGGKVRKLRWISKSGAPDRIVWWPMKPFPRMAFVELKAPGKKPTKVQLIEHESLRDDGFKVYVVDSIEMVDFVIKEVMSKAKPSTAPKVHIDVKSPPNLPPVDNTDLA